MQIKGDWADMHLCALTHTMQLNTGLHSLLSTIAPSSKSTPSRDGRRKTSHKRQTTGKELSREKQVLGSVMLPGRLRGPYRPH